MFLKCFKAAIFEYVKEKNAITFLTAFCRNVSPPSSGLKSNASRKPALLRLTFNEVHCVISEEIEL
jgi:hypothetical protein